VEFVSDDEFGVACARGGVVGAAMMVDVEGGGEDAGGDVGGFEVLVVEGI